MEEDEDEDQENDEVITSQQYSSPSSPRRTSSRQQIKNRKISENQSSEEEFEEEEEVYDNDNDSDEIRPSPRHKHSQSTPHKHLTKCYSETDAITLESLPALHVCYLAPDKVNKLCFSLETLYKASLIQGSQQMRPNGSGKIAFLQPPHFRTLMDDILLDQIAARFGRNALNIEDSDVYKKEKNLNALQRGYASFYNDEEDGNENAFNFQRSFGQYLKRQMGSGDVYCCCICYTEAQHRFLGCSLIDDDSSDDDENDDNEYSLQSVTSSKIDPMTILGGLDDDEYNVASTFCFSKVSLVKAHIRSVHNEDTSLIRGNDLYQRFKVCAHFLYSFLINIVHFLISYIYCCWLDSSTRRIATESFTRTRSWTKWT